MPNVIIAHKVEDLDRWLGYKAERATVLSQFGSNVTDHVSMDGYPFISVSMDVPDVAALQAAVATPSPELAEAMQRHGVIPPLTFLIEK